MNAKITFLEIISAIPFCSSTGIGFHRTTGLMTMLDLWDYVDSVDKLVIVGTDGKGSTATMSEHIIRAGGRSTGLMISPHFLDFNERFKVNGIPADYATLLTGLNTVMAAKTSFEAQSIELFSAYELYFVLALWLFRQSNVSVLIMEAGIGGRYDLVRLLKGSLVALTTVSLEHTDMLGDNLQEIAYNKLDACAPGGQVVLGHLDPQLVEQLYSYAPLTQITLIEAAQTTGLTLNDDGLLNITFDQSPANCPPITVQCPGNSPFYGLAQQHNLQTAVTLCRLFLTDTSPAEFASQCQQGIETVYLPGRFEQIADQPPLYIDAAHTPDAYDQLFATIGGRFADAPWIFVTGISKDREHQQLAQYLLTFGHHIIVTQAQFKGADPQVLMSTLEEKAHKEAQRQTPTLSIEPMLSDALEQAKTLAQAINGRIFVVGGLFLAREAAATVHNRDLLALTKCHRI